MCHLPLSESKLLLQSDGLQQFDMVAETLDGPTPDPDKDRRRGKWGPKKQEVKEEGVDNNLAPKKLHWCSTCIGGRHVV